MSGTDEDGITSAVRLAIEQARTGVKFERPVDYRDTNYSDKAVRIILSSRFGVRR